MTSLLQADEVQTAGPTITWERLLSEKHKVFFSSPVYLEEGFTNEFYYQNAGLIAEEVVAVFFNEDGTRVSGVRPVSALLRPAQSLVIDATTLFAQAGQRHVRGSVMVVVHPTEVVEGDDLTQRDFVCFWSSGKDRHACHIGIGGLKDLNIVGKKEGRIYNMFCPTVVSNEKQKTVIAILNHSSDAQYSDEVAITPVLTNQDGKAIEGKTLTAKPFGIFFLDVDDVFGEKGQSLLKETDGRGTVTVIHKGHAFITMFFHVHKQTHEILSGTHTTPAASLPYNYAITHPFINAWAEKNPLFYLLWKLKHFRKSDWFVNLYPPRPLLMNSIFSYIAQSRWVLQIRYLSRALFFLTVRGFRIKVVEDTSAGNLKHVVENQLWDHFNAFHFARARVEMMLHLLLMAPTVRSGKTLCIGPRNEGEILLFKQYFSDVIGIDLFSYVPSILVMDAHALTFEDNTFDTINCGWIFTYVHDLPSVIREIVRVAKPGAFISCAYTMPGPTDQAPSNGTDMSRTAIPEIIQLFGDAVGHVYWRDDAKMTRGEKHHLVFQIKK